jgi:ribosomal-protein-alanine N-acetyltransferase
MGFDDLDRVMEIEREVYEFPWTRGNFKDSIESDYRCIVMERAGFVAGYGVMMVIVDEAHLLNLSVAKNWQGMGMGRKLLEHLMSIAKRESLKFFYLEVRVSNKVAQGLYESSGFSEIAVRPGYYPDKAGREDALLMGAEI